MICNRMMVKHRWQRIREQTKRWWGELTDNDLMHIDGDRDKLIALIQRKYGRSREEVSSLAVRLWEHVNMQKGKRDFYRMIGLLMISSQVESSS